MATDSKIKEQEEEVKAKTVNMSALMSDLKTGIEQDISDRSNWEKKLTRMHKLRMGIKKKKHFPWSGASNLRFKLADKYIRKIKPIFVNVIHGIRPICVMEPQSEDDVEGAKQREKIMDWLLTRRMDIFRPSVKAQDIKCEKGKTVYKIVWKTTYKKRSETFKIEELGPEAVTFLRDPMTTDDEIQIAVADHLKMNMEDEDHREAITDAIKQFREGNEEIMIDWEEEDYDAPELIAEKPERVIVPSDTVDGIQNARRVCHEMYKTLNELKAKGIYNNLDKTEEGLTTGDQGQLESTKDVREGIKRDVSKLIRVWEIYFYWSPKSEEGKKDALPEKHVLTMAPDQMIDMRFIKFPYDHGLWPFVDDDLEITDGRWYSSRGVPELIEAWAREVDHQENAKLDRQTLSNAMPFFIRAGAGVDPRRIKWIPGYANQLRDPKNDIFIPTLPDVSISYERESLILKAHVEEYLGIMDFTLTRAQQPGTKRTATELKQMEQHKAETLSLDAKQCQQNMKLVYEQVMALWAQYGPDETSATVLGEDLKYTTLKMTREEIKQKLNFLPNGTLSNTNQVLESQKSLIRLQLAIEDQTGIADKYEHWKEYYQQEGIKNIDKLLKKPPEEVPGQMGMPGQMGGGQKITQEGGVGQ